MENYTSMTLESIDADGSTNSGKIFKDVTETTTSYTYRSPAGLLSTALFTKTTLTLRKTAPIEDMRSRGLI